MAEQHQQQQQIKCPHCGQAYALTAEQVPQYAGQTVACTRCAKPFTVPASIARAASARAASGRGLGSGGPAAARVAATSVNPPPPAAGHAPRGVPPAAQPPPPFRPHEHPGAAYAGYPPIGYAAVPATSGLAIASLALGVASLVLPLFGVVAIVLAIAAVVRTSRDPQLRGRGFAIAGIALAVVSFALWGCVATVMLPAVRQGRHLAQQARCAGNLTQIGQALMIYAQANQGVLPDDLTHLVLDGTLPQSIVFTCPTSGDVPANGATPQQTAQLTANDGYVSYTYVAGGTPLAKANGRTVLAYERPGNHPRGGINVLWGDGRVTNENGAVAAGVTNIGAGGPNPPPVVSP